MQVCIIVAMAENRVIGRDNQLPWYIPDDLRHFKAITMGKPIIMGRKTFESLNKPLPGRTNIVITRNPKYCAEGCAVVSNLEQAIASAEEVALAEQADEIMIIGGASIYAAALPKVDKIYLTQIHQPLAGDTYFPEIKWSDWKVIAQDYRPQAHPVYRYSFLALQRVNALASCDASNPSTQLERLDA